MLQKGFQKMANKCLPHFCSGPIVKGFGRGSKELGCPTGILNTVKIILYLVRAEVINLESFYHIFLQQMFH